MGEADGAHPSVIYTPSRWLHPAVLLRHGARAASSCTVYKRYSRTPPTPGGEGGGGGEQQLDSP